MRAILPLLGLLCAPWLTAQEAPAAELLHGLLQRAARDGAPAALLVARGDAAPWTITAGTWQGSQPFGFVWTPRGRRGGRGEGGERSGAAPAIWNGTIDELLAGCRWLLADGDGNGDGNRNGTAPPAAAAAREWFLSLRSGRVRELRLQPAGGDAPATGAPPDALRCWISPSRQRVVILVWRRARDLDLRWQRDILQLVDRLPHAPPVAAPSPDSTAPAAPEPTTTTTTTPAPTPAPAPAPPDPAQPGPAEVHCEEFELPATGTRRALPVRAFWPATGEALPIVVQVPDAPARAAADTGLCRHWASHGFVVLQPCAPVVDLPDADLALRQADVIRVLDALDAVAAAVPELRTCWARDRIAVAGTGGAAAIALRLGGVSWQNGERRLGARDPRIGAALALSSFGLGQGGIDTAGFGGLAVPALFTVERSDPVAGQPAGWRRQAFELAPPGGKYLLTLDAIADGRLPKPGGGKWQGDGAQRAQTAASTAFLLAEVNGDAVARQWLADGAGLRLDRR